MRSRSNILPTLLARWVSTASFLPAALFAAAAFAAAPYLSGPSVVSAGESAVFRGGNFASQDFVNVSTSAMVRAWCRSAFWFAEEASSDACRR